MTTLEWKTTGDEVVKKFADRVKGKTIVITGASQNGLGGETAIALAQANPEHLILVARSLSKVEPVISRIKEISPTTKVDFVSMSLDDPDSVRAGAAEINSKISKLDILINNAGIMATQNYTTNKAGIEIQFATNHIGHFLFTKILFPKILAAAPGSRIVNLTSLGHKIGPVRLDDCNFSDGKEYDPWSSYGQSKTANILFSLYLANKLKDRGIQSYAVHPGHVMGTSLADHIDDLETLIARIEEAAQKNTGKHFPMDEDAPKTINQGAATTLTAALNPGIEAQSGVYMADCQPQKTYDYADSMENAEKLWKLSEKLVGEKFEI